MMMLLKGCVSNTLLKKEKEIAIQHYKHQGKGLKKKIQTALLIRALSHYTNLRGKHQ